MRYLLFSVSALLTAIGLSGCETVGTAGLGEEAGSTRLPTGLTLLESDEGACNGIVVLESGVSGDDDERRISPGQNAVFEFEDDDDDEDVDWICLGDQSTESHTLECPDEASYVRVTRQAAGEELLFECYG